MKCLLPILLAASSALAQAPSVARVDPPNWWPAMPAPMLLIQGENLAGASITLSDPRLRVTRTTVSANGHYAQLWLAADAARPETIRITVHTPAGHASAPFVFAPRRAPSDGLSGFSAADVLYLIMPDRFADGDPSNDGPDHAVQLALPRGWHGGDLRGITQHLDYLQQLGITTVWITPVTQNHNPQSYHGYGATDLYAVDEHFGTLQDYKHLAEALHARHMKLVLDIVPNHIGPGHPWVQDSPDPTWFHGTLAHHTEAQGEFAPVTNPHAPWRDQENVTQGWFANVLPDMNQEDPAVATYLTQNVIWWVEQAGVDGLRIDTFPYVGRPFWHDFHAQIHGLYPHLTTVGEIFNGDPTITSAFAGGVTRVGRNLNVDTGLDTPFDFPTYFALRNVFLKDAPMTALAEVLRLDELFPHPERLVPFLGNHDTARFMNDPAATPQKLDLAFTILTTMRGMPQIYAGDEIAMRGGDDPDNRRDFPGGFGNSQPSAFNAATRSPEQQYTFATVQNLLTIRRQHPALQTGEEQVLEVDQDSMVYVRILQQHAGVQRVLIAINKAAAAKELSLDTAETAISDARAATPLLGDASVVTLAPHRLTLRLPAQTATIVDLQ
jgi:glycosidase